MVLIVFIIETARGKNCLCSRVCEVCRDVSHPFPNSAEVLNGGKVYPDYPLSRLQNTYGWINTGYRYKNKLALQLFLFLDVYF